MPFGTKVYEEGMSNPEPRLAGIPCAGRREDTRKFRGRFLIQLVVLQSLKLPEDGVTGGLAG